MGWVDYSSPCLGLHHRLYRPDHLLLAGYILLFQWRGERNRAKGRGDPEDGSIQPIKGFFGDEGGNFSAGATELNSFMNDDHAMRFADRSQNGVLIQRAEGAGIQYLDADDCLEPDKIARQVRFLEETQADVVYGDWRYRRHLPDIRFSYLDKIEISGVQQDMLASLLSGRWWVAPGAVLYRRQVINEVGGWDETLRAAQDRDFFTSVALSGAKIRYQSGCHFIYRRYGAVTVSSSSLGRWVENHCLSLKKSEVALARSDRLTEEYRAALAFGYFAVARGTAYTIDARPSYAIYAKMLDGLTEKVLDLCPHFHAADETRIFAALEWLLGFRFATRLFWVRLIIHGVKMKLRNTFLLGVVLRMRRVNLQREAKDHYGPSVVGQKGPIGSASS